MYPVGYKILEKKKKKKLSSSTSSLVYSKDHGNKFTVLILCIELLDRWFNRKVGSVVTLCGHEIAEKSKSTLPFCLSV